MRAFGEILAENRKKKGYSQSDLVKLLSREGIQVTTKAVSKWETNSREPALHISPKARICSPRFYLNFLYALYSMYKRKSTKISITEKNNQSVS